ncbi:MAG: hypothetical protein AAFV53_43410 [Myxococcota bacterium]
MEIDPGRGEPLEAGGELMGKNIVPMITFANMDLATLTQQVAALLNDISSLIAAIKIDDPEFQDAVDKLTTRLIATANGEGNLGRLLADDQLLDEVEALLRQTQQMLDSLSPMIEELSGAAASVDAAGDAVVVTAGSVNTTADGIDDSLSALPQTLNRMDRALDEMTQTLDALQRIPGVRRAFEQ